MRESHRSYHEMIKKYFPDLNVKNYTFNISVQYSSKARDLPETAALKVFFSAHRKIRTALPFHQVFYALS